MPLKIQLIFSLLFVFVHGKDLDIIVKLDSKQIIDTLTSEASIKYLTELAEVFAKKAAQSFIREIKKNKNLISNEDPRSEKLSNEKKEKTFRNPKLNEEKALKLINEPLSDGDDVGWHSPELSGENYAEKKPTAVQVYGLTKVNGIYVRRLLGIRTK